MKSPLQGKLKLDKAIKKTTWLEVGRYEGCSIQDVDTSTFPSNGQVKVTFEHEQRTHREVFFLLSKEGDNLSWRLSNLITSIFPGPDIKDYYEWLTADDWERGLESLRGMKLTVTVADGPGYRIEFDQDKQQYLATENGEVLHVSEQLTSLERLCKARKHKKAYRTAKAFESGEDYIIERNFLALRTALQRRQEGETSTPDRLATKTARFIRPTTKK